MIKQVENIYEKLIQRDEFTSTIQWIIRIILILIPLININEIKWATGFGDFNARGGLFVIKYIKDIGMIAIVGISILQTLYKRKLPETYKLLPFVTIGICIQLIFSNQQPTIVLLAGLRWLYPLFLFIFLSGHIDKPFLKDVFKILFGLLIIHLLLQTYELFYMPPYNGTTYFGLTSRVPGIFSHPHSAASFVCLFYLCSLPLNLPQKRKYLIEIISFISIIFSMSSTGMIVFLIMFFLAKIKNSIHFRKWFLISPLLVLLLFSNADLLTNRNEGSSASSIGNRKELLYNIFEESELISPNFGLSTNVIVTLYGNSNRNVIWSDAFYGSFLANLGLLPFTCLLITTGIIFIVGFRQKNIFLISSIVLYSLFSFSTIITEVYPLNLFIGIIAAYIINEKNQIPYEYISIANLLQQKSLHN